MITYQVENWASYRADCDALWAEHYEELAVRKERMKMKPDEPSYRQMDAAGALVILTIRENGALIGYLTSVVRPHLHYADTLCGYEDAYFLTKDRRRGFTGYKLFAEWIKVMRNRGVQLVFAMTKPWLDNGPLLKRLGFDKTDDVYAMWIGEA